MDLHTVILAAGKGTRMKSKVPKVLHKLANRPLLTHVFDTVLSLNPSQISTVVGHASEQVIAAFSAGDDSDNINWVQQREQLGTGHAILQVLPWIQPEQTVLVLYADVPLIEKQTLLALLEATKQSQVTLLTTHLDNPEGYGRIIRDDQGFVRRIIEEKDASEQEKQIKEVNTGIMAVSGKFLQEALPKLSNQNAQGEYYLTDLIEIATSQNCKVATKLLENPTEAAGINDLQQLAKLERAYRTKQVTALMQQGVSFIDPERVDIRGDLSVGQDIKVDINVIFEGRVVLSDDVQIGAHCILKDVELGQGVVVKPFTYIEGAVIEGSCELGPYARIRPGTQMAKGAKAGNFVEIKKSIIGANSKVNHLSYIGDAELESDVNIGAGTITCNYDGVRKHKTKIERKAFVGSNTALVAPLTIETGATIGAGSTLSKDAPADTLTLARAKQQTIPLWKRPEKD